MVSNEGEDCIIIFRLRHNGRPQSRLYAFFALGHLLLAGVQRPPDLKDWREKSRGLPVIFLGINKRVMTGTGG